MSEAVPFARLRGEVLRERRNVVTPLAERWDSNRQDLEPIE
jgi:hypothetical protein